MKKAAKVILAGSLAAVAHSILANVAQLPAKWQFPVTAVCTAVAYYLPSPAAGDETKLQ